MVTALIRAGAKADRRDAQGFTALDYAVKLNLIPAIRLIDISGQYAVLIKKFESEYPSAPNSRFLGQWSNNRDGFNTVTLRIDPDGTAFMSGGMMAAILGWKETGLGEATMTMLPMENIDKSSLPTVQLTLDPEAKVLNFVPSKGEKQLMQRVDSKR
jgi:hypothetical protein